jgi:hypothetical protein
VSRDFFKKAGLGAGAVGAAAVGLAADETKAAEPAKSGAGGRGYQETATANVKERSMLTKKTNGVANGPRLSRALTGVVGSAMDRRTFLKRSGLTAGGTALAASGAFAMVKKADAAEASGGDVQVVKSVCTHCSVGCTVMAEVQDGVWVGQEPGWDSPAEVQDGVWVGQEPGWDSPFNLGAHCAKGAAVREMTHGERRLKYPVKLEGGKWTKISWEQAIDEIGDKMLEIREQSGPDSVYWLGSAKHSNEQAYLFRKFYAFWGSNNATCSASSTPSGAPTTVTTRRGSATRPRSRVLPTPGATAR